MGFRVLHFSSTPLAGAPIRLVQALREHTDHEVRLVDLQRWGLYDHDLVFSEQPDEVVELAAKADIIHLHNYLDSHSTCFAPIDFERLRRRGTALVRQFHTHPEFVAQVMGVSPSAVLSCPLPSLVIAQSQERFYPQARVVPNLLPCHSAALMPGTAEAGRSIAFTPTSTRGAWEDRWNTKGVPETLALLRQVARATGWSVDCITDRPLEDALAAKRAAGLVVDDLVTGGYHLSGLEGLCLGKPVLAYLDERTQRVLRFITGADTSPFVNVRLEDARGVLESLCANPEVAADLGRAGRAWIDRYWLPQTLVRHFDEAYRQLLTDPGLVCRQEALRLDEPAERFFAIALPDAVYHARAARAHAALPLGARVLGSARQRGRTLYHRCRKALPTLARALGALRRRAQGGQEGYKRST